MRVKLNDFYSGVPSNNRMIYPGEYEDNDPRLYDLATYLVKTGHALVLESEPTEPITDEVVEIGLGEMTVAQLQEMAKQRGLELKGRLNKAGLIALLEGDDAEGDDQADDDAEEDEGNGDNA